MTGCVGPWDNWAISSGDSGCALGTALAWDTQVVTAMAVPRATAAAAMVRIRTVLKFIRTSV
jgi:hypothetical protein